MGAIVIINNSSSAVSVFVSKYSRKSANDDWFSLGPGKRDSWTRDGWELVAFKNANDTDRAGRYVRVNSTVTFNSLGNIVVN